MPSALAGTLVIDSPPDAGTRIRAEIPLPLARTPRPVGFADGERG